MTCPKCGSSLTSTWTHTWVNGVGEWFCAELSCLHRWSGPVLPEASEAPEDTPSREGQDVFERGMCQKYEVCDDRRD